MRHIVDIECWERRNTYLFFKDFFNPIVAFTADVDCTSAYLQAKKRGESFFLHYLYAILQANNQIEEFRYRIEQKGDEEPVVALYDHIDTLTPIRIAENGAFREVRIVYDSDFDTYYHQATQTIAALDPDAPTFNAPHCDNSERGICCISALPDLRFTSVSHTLKSAGGVNQIPLINVGKMVQSNQRYTMPVAVSIHHGLADGKQIADFIACIEQQLR